jgi:16S rRNA (guanine(966)-N(2))-methyltransferase RsmD
MRIGRGEYKGRSFKVPLRIRPASLRLKKALFDILGDELAGCDVLDLFAGSGALGFEALSAGARRVVFVDVKSACVGTIRENAVSLNLLDKIKCIRNDAFRTLADFRRKDTQFQIVFLDPPYYGEISKKALQILDEYDIVAALGYIVVLRYRDEHIPLALNKFELIVEKTYGQSAVAIYRKKQT